MKHTLKGNKVIYEATKKPFIGSFILCSFCLNACGAINGDFHVGNFLGSLGMGIFKTFALLGKI